MTNQPQNKEKDFKDMTNDELVKAMQTLSDNNEIVKQETIKLMALLESIQKQYLEASTELNKRMGVNIENPQK